MKKFLFAAALILSVVAQVSSVQAIYDPYANDANFAYVYAGFRVAYKMNFYN